MDKRHFIQLCAMTAALLPLMSIQSALASSSSNPRRLPLRLNKGDAVALVCPSKAMDDKLDIQIAQEVLQALGFKVKPGKHLSARRGHLAGTDIERASDLNEAFADKGVKAIICISGGSGAARLLPLLDYSLIRNNPKVLLGFSDITALHNAIHAQTGLITFHGPNASASWNPFNVDQFRRVFFDRELMHYQNVHGADDDLVQRQNRTITINSGKVRGELIGGNLTVLTALAGSSYLL